MPESWGRVGLGSLQATMDWPNFKVKLEHDRIHRSFSNLFMPHHSVVHPYTHSQHQFQSSCITALVFSTAYTVKQTKTRMKITDRGRNLIVWSDNLKYLQKIVAEFKLPCPYLSSLHCKYTIFSTSCLCHLQTISNLHFSAWNDM